MLAYHSTRVVTCAMLPWCPPMLVTVGVKAPRVKDSHPGWGSRVQESPRAVLPHISCQEREAWTESRNRGSHKLTDVRG